MNDEGEQLKGIEWAMKKVECVLKEQRIREAWVSIRSNLRVVHEADRLGHRAAEN